MKACDHLAKNTGTIYGILLQDQGQEVGDREFLHFSSRNNILLHKKKK